MEQISAARATATAGGRMRPPAIERRAGEGLLGQRLLIDNEREEGIVCQNGTLGSPLDDAASPPFPLRLSTVSPPNPLPTLTVT